MSFVTFVVGMWTGFVLGLLFAGGGRMLRALRGGVVETLRVPGPGMAGAAGATGV